MTIFERLALKVENAGGRAFYVGGYVRDKALGCQNKDIDIEVHGISEEELEKILSEFGNIKFFGSSFGVYSISGINADISLPRSERKIGNGHRDFEVVVDPFIGIKEAARRRDFTINAIMEDILTGEIIDPFNGSSDMCTGIIKHVDDKTFVEDPLRVLRATQFSARFDFKIAPETIELCKTIDLSALSSERIEIEMKKALLKSKKPSSFFENLRKINQLGYWFKELEQLIGLEQNPKYHLEGDVWTHTMIVLDNAAKFRNEVSDAYSFMLFALMHDLGKIETTQIIDSRIHSYNHEIVGVEIAERLLERVCHEKKVKNYVLKSIPLHMRPSILFESKSKVKKTNKLFDEAVEPKDLIYFSLCDKHVETSKKEELEKKEFLFERLRVYEETMEQPYIAGKDLLELGFKPGVELGKMLELAHKLRLAGVSKEKALKQVLAVYGKKQ